MLYLVKINDEYLKIGFTKNLINRLKGLETTYAFFTLAFSLFVYKRFYILLLYTCILVCFMQHLG